MNRTHSDPGSAMTFTAYVCVMPTKPHEPVGTNKRRYRRSTTSSFSRSRTRSSGRTSRTRTSRRPTPWRGSSFRSRFPRCATTSATRRSYPPTRPRNRRRPSNAARSRSSGAHCRATRLRRRSDRAGRPHGARDRRLRVAPAALTIPARPPPLPGGLVMPHVGRLIHRFVIRRAH